MGAVLGLPAGPGRMVTEALVLPAIVAGLALAMAPALYIGLSLGAVAPPARAVVHAVGAGWQAQGLVLAGLAPAAAFLLATTQSPWVSKVLGLALVGTATLLGLRSLYERLREHGAPKPRLAALFALWALVGLGLGAHFFLATLAT
jgi:hypothetical protein